MAVVVSVDEGVFSREEEAARMPEVDLFLARTSSDPPSSSLGGPKVVGAKKK